MNKKVFLLCLTPFFGAWATEYYWNPNALTGFLDGGLNWVNAVQQTGSVPGAGDTGKFGNNSIQTAAEYTVKIPVTGAGYYQDRAATYVNGLPSGTKVTFDATGTTWLKQSEPGVAWDGKVFRFDNADHIFNMEGWNVSDTVRDPFAFTLQNGIVSFTSDEANGDTLAFESGVFNNAFLPDGTTKAIHSTILQWSTHRAHSKVVMKPGSTTYLRAIQVRGQTPGGVWRIEGGDHHIHDGLSLNYAKGAVDTEALMHVAGGKVTVENDPVWIGSHANGAARLKIDGTGEFEHKGNAVYFPDGANWYGYLDIGGSGVYRSSSSGMSVGHNGGLGYITVSGQGRMLVSNTVHLAEGNNGTGELWVKDDGFVFVNSLAMAQGAGRTARITLQDNASLQFNGGTWANNDTATAEFGMTGNAQVIITSGNNCEFGGNNSGVVKMNLMGGVIHNGAGSDAAANWIMKGGPGSEYMFNGVEAHIRNLAVEGKVGVPDTTNTVVLKSGTLAIRTSGIGDGLDVRGNGRNAMVLVEGGELTLGNNGAGMLRLGHGGPNNGYHAVFRQTGGVVVEDCVVNMCDAAGSDGEFELLGGVFRGRDIRGWNGSVYRGGTGWGRCYFNGGTLQPVRDNVTLIYTMPECSVGPVGLTVDTIGRNTKISAKFQNDGAGTANEVDGRFVKTGLGTLTLNMLESDSSARGEYAGQSLDSFHSATVVNGGAVQFENAEACQFGQNVSVADGAVLTLAGQPATLTVETISLGNGKGFSTLYLDEGDTVIVNGANGVAGNCGAIDGPWTVMNGSHAVFICRQGVDVGELAKITVLNALAGKDYRWITAEDGEGNTVCSLVIADQPLTEASAWTGSVSSTWPIEGNWSGSVPTRAMIATFGDVGNKTVSTVAGAAAGKLAFSADGYVVQGGDTLTVASGISSTVGTQTLAAPLLLGRVFEMNVAADSEVVVGGSISGTGTDFMKTGSGKLVLNGLNADFRGVLACNGGMLDVVSHDAFGSSSALFFPLTLKGGTLTYSGSVPVAFNAPLAIAADAAKKPVILNTVGVLTFPSVAYTQGAFVKLGPGTLAFDLPAGEYSLGSGDASEYLENGGQVDLPASGDSPASLSGLYGVTVLEGTLSVQGQGADKTVFHTRNTAQLGSGYKGAAPAILEVKDARVNWGAGSRHGSLMRDLPAGSPAPEIHLDNAYLWADSMRIGYSSAEGARPVIRMRNATFFNHYNATVGAVTANPIIDADNSKLYSDAMLGWKIEASILTADFYGPDAMFGSVNGSDTGSNAGLITSQDDVTGSLVIRDGASFETTRGIRFNQSQLAVTFDGGIFRIRTHQTETNEVSTWARAESGFTAQGNGLTFDIAGGSAHALTFPIRGTASVRKTGAGTFKLVEGRAIGEALLQNTGVTEVKEGALVLNGALAAPGAALTVDEAGTLDLNATTLAVKSLAGAGTVRNGTMATPILLSTADEHVLTFTDVTLPANQMVTLDLGGEALTWTPKTVVVANLGADCVVGADGVHVSGWKATGTNVRVDGVLTEACRLDAQFAYEPSDGTVTLTYKRFNLGTLVIFR